MTAYLVVMIAFALLAVLAPREKPDRLTWAIAFVVLVLFVGLRHKVGMDWNNYLIMIGRVNDVPFSEAFRSAEPGYAILLWLAAKSGLGIYGANLVGAVVLMLGVFRFSSRTPLPWVSLAAALPFLVIVVGMSANRQAMAIGVLFWLVAGWQQYSLRKRVLLTLLAAMFHFSAIFFLMFCVLGLRMKVGQKLAVSFLSIAAMVAFLQLSGGAEYYDQLYVTGQTDITFSPGAIMHVLLNGLPGLLVMMNRPIRSVLFPNSLAVQMAWVAIAMIPLALLYSVASGRMTLYLFPVSMYVFSAFPSLLPNSIQRAVVRTVAASIMITVLWLWLAYSNSSLAHIPYENAVWMDVRDLQL